MMKYHKERSNDFISEKIHDFNQSIKLGETGESIIFDWFDKQAYTKEIKDVRDDPTFQKDDIDFIVYHENGKEYTIEVKTDQYTSLNIFYETVSAVETDSKGCMSKSKAKYLAYYFIKFGKLYIIDLKKFNEWMTNQIAKRCPVAEFKQFKNLRYNGTTYTSQGYTMPLLYLENNFPDKYLKVHYINQDQPKS